VQLVGSWRGIDANVETYGHDCSTTSMLRKKS
jgi:hypothetical protein